MEITPGTQRGLHTTLVASCSWDHCPLPFTAGNTMFGHTQRFGELCLLSLRSYHIHQGRGLGLAGAPKAPDKPGDSSRIIWFQGREALAPAKSCPGGAPLDKGWEHKASCELFMPSMGVWEVWGHSWGFPGAPQDWSVVWVWVFGAPDVLQSCPYLSQSLLSSEKTGGN